MDLLKTAFNEALARNTSENERWNKYEEDHQQAIVNLEQFRKAIDVDIMVPIGSKALMPGKLIHTNEIFLSHTPTYYSKCSAHQAMEICKHRIQVAQQRLDALTIEREMYQNKLDLPVTEDAFSAGGEEIIEEFDEEEERRWQQLHRQKLKAQKALERIEREANKADETKIFDKLDELELMEELDNELEALHIDDDETLKKILSGEVPVPVDKKRVTHGPVSLSKSAESKMIKSETSAQPKSALVTIQPQNSSSSDSSEEDSEDEQTKNFREKYNEAVKMSTVEKLEYYEMKLQDAKCTYEALCNTVNLTFEQVIEKADAHSEIDYLQSEIDRAEDRLESGDPEPPAKELVMKRQEMMPMKPQNTLKSRKIPNLENIGDENRVLKASHGRNVRFAPEDAVTSFSKFEEPYKVGSKGIDADDELSIDDAKIRLNEYILKVANLDVEKTTFEMNEMYKNKVADASTKSASSRDIIPPNASKVPESVTNETIANIHSVTGKSILKNVEAVQNEMHLGKSTTIEENDEEESEQQETVEFEKILGDIVEKKIKTELVRESEPEPGHVNSSKDNPRISVFKARRQK